jgi:8-oxo-dGTP diphosphatase
MSTDGLHEAFSKRLRIRVCGIVVESDKILLVNIQSPTRNEPFWTPPGGGLEFGESLKDAVKREIQEETGLIVEPTDLMYTSEFIKDPYHAVEYYWRCHRLGGNVVLGTDPEFDRGNQMLKAVEFIDLDQLAYLPVFPEYIRDHLLNDYFNPTHSTIHFSQIF